MPDVSTAEQWDDEWWNYWQEAKRFHSGEVAAKHADIVMSELHGLRPPEQPVRVITKVDLLGTDQDGEPAFRVLGQRTEPHRGWLRRAIDRVFG